MGKNSGSTVGSILAGVVGGGVFLLFWILLGLSMLPSLAIGAAAFGAGLLVFRRKPRDMSIEATGMTTEMRDMALKEGEEKIAKLRALSPRIGIPTVRTRFDAVVAAARNILDDLKKDPKDIRAARQFLSYYLDATVTIVSRYVELAGKGLAATDIQASLRKVESMLGVIQEAFEKQHARLLQDDVMDLDAEMAVLKQTIAMEGLGSEEEKK